MLDLVALDEKYEHEYLQFQRVENKRSNRPDVHAFILLDALMPAKKTDDILSAAEHDGVWLGVSTEKFSEVATEEQFVELMRCGVLYDEDCESFRMNV